MKRLESRKRPQKGEELWPVRAIQSDQGLGGGYLKQIIQEQLAKAYSGQIFAEITLKRRPRWRCGWRMERPLSWLSVSVVQSSGQHKIEMNSRRLDIGPCSMYLGRCGVSPQKGEPGISGRAGSLGAGEGFPPPEPPRNEYLYLVIKYISNKVISE